MSLPSQLRRETAVDRDRWVWRTPLEKSQPFWSVPSLSRSLDCACCLPVSHLHSEPQLILPAEDDMSADLSSGM